MTKKQTKSGDTSTIQTLRTRLVTTIRFIESTQEFPSGEAFRAAIEKAADENDLRTLRLLGREIDAMATVAVPRHERDGLDAILEYQLGVDREGERAATAKRVAAAIGRGTIASEAERRHIEDYLEVLEAMGGDATERDAVRRLLGRG